ncbi:hypothetical protein CAEBREN_13568 [Caenorhabditis brenneri]|uniref:C2H2-type domain-containing protein n=1 Tax=Caenorhabditis brenneri TaxID=135651 RepID=G0P7P4_CAEBE|nr:hypothetical protein CAEBREN_13568 [Caenorhabditis brenneri]
MQIITHCKKELNDLKAAQEEPEMKREVEEEENVNEEEDDAHSENRTHNLYCKLCECRFLREDMAGYHRSHHTNGNPFKCAF